MSGFKDIIRKERINRNLPLRKVAAELDIDQSVLSKIENGERNAKREHIPVLAELFSINERSLLVAWMAEQILREFGDDELALEAIQEAKHQIKHNKKKK